MYIVMSRYCAAICTCGRQELQSNTFSNIALMKPNLGGSWEHGKIEKGSTSVCVSKHWSQRPSLLLDVAVGSSSTNDILSHWGWASSLRTVSSAAAASTRPRVSISCNNSRCWSPPIWNNRYTLGPSCGLHCKIWSALKVREYHSIVWQHNQQISSPTSN